MRELTRDGVRWTVREIGGSDPSVSRGAGCLIFDSDSVVRRVWSYPTGWEDLSDTQLWELVCGVAHVVAPPPERHTIAWVDERRELVLAAEMAERARELLTQIRTLRDSNQRLRQESIALREECRMRRSEMRAVIETYAATMRDEGIAPEQAIVRIKCAMRTGAGAVISVDDLDAETMLHDAVAWGIAAYYAA